MAWYDSSWLYRVGVTALATQVGQTALDYPLYLPLSLMPAGFWSHVQNGGGDIRVTATDGTTELAIDPTSCNTGTSLGELHFKSDAVSTSTNRTFYVYYGNAAASAYSPGDPYGRNFVWNSIYERVFHLGDSGASAVDSTGNSSGVWNGNLPNVATGKLLNGQSTDGTLDWVDTNRTESTAWEWSTWVKFNSLANSFSTIIGIDSGSFALLDVTSAGALSVFTHDGISGNNFGITGLTTGTFYLLHFVREGNSTTNGYKAYLNGVLMGQANTGTWTSSGNVLLGARPTQGGAQDLAGVLDEARFSTNGARPTGTFVTEYNNQNSPGTFWSIGAEETEPVIIPGPFCVQAIQGYRGGRTVRARTGGATALDVRTGGARSIGVECNRG